MQIKYLETNHINHQIIHEKNEILTAQRKTRCFFVKRENWIGLYTLRTQLLMISRISSPVGGLKNKKSTRDISCLLHENIQILRYMYILTYHLIYTYGKSRKCTDSWWLHWCVEWSLAKNLKIYERKYSNS